MVNLRAYLGKIICVAVSGGVDSTSLLHYLKAEEQTYGYKLCAVNFEHGIRGEESLLDTEFVKGICKEWAIPLYCFSCDCVKKSEEEKISLEEAARNFRREGYFALINEQKADVIATAHHADDLAETALFRLARGSSIGGVLGIEEETKYFIRPFLDMSKEEIYSYAKEHGVPYREDKSNFVADVSRNKLRLEVLPLLETVVPSAKKGLCRFAKQAKADDEYLCRLASSLVSFDGKNYKVECSNELPLFRRACLFVLKKLGVEKDYTQAHFESLYLLQYSVNGARVSLPCGVVAIKEKECILFCKGKEGKEPIKELCIPFQLGEFDTGRYSLSISLEEKKEAERDGFKPLFFDLDKIPAGALIRFRKTGDEIEKFGGGTKSLKKFLTDKKVPASISEGLPIIAKEKEVYAVCGVEISSKVKVTDETKRIAYITLTKK